MNLLELTSDASRVQESSDPLKEHAEFDIIQAEGVSTSIKDCSLIQLHQGRDGERKGGMKRERDNK